MKWKYISISALLLTACTSVLTFPKQQAKAVCKSMFSCMDAETISDITGYASIDECKESETATILSSKSYADWAADSSTFNSDDAQTCIDELKSLRSSSECDGDMDYGEVLLSCITADNYPQRFADAVCLGIFECLGSSDISFFTGYDDLEECQEDQTAAILNTAGYDSWEEGDADFNQRSARNCLEEILEIREDSACNGSMNVLSFLADAGSDDCVDIYD